MSTIKFASFKLFCYFTIIWFGNNFNFRDPWSYNHLFGWIGEYTFQMISGDLYLIISMLFASFFISVCLHHRAFSEQFQALLNQLDVKSKELITQTAQKHDEQNQQYNHMRQKEIHMLLHRIVQFHILTTE